MKYRIALLLIAPLFLLACAVWVGFLVAGLYSLIGSEPVEPVIAILGAIAWCATVGFFLLDYCNNN